MIKVGDGHLEELSLERLALHSLRVLCRVDGILFTEYLAFADDGALQVEALGVLLERLDVLELLHVFVPFRLGPLHEELGDFGLLVSLLVHLDVLDLLELAVKHDVDVASGISLRVDDVSSPVLLLLEVVGQLHKGCSRPMSKMRAPSKEFDHLVHLLLLDLTKALLVVLSVHHGKEARRSALNGGCPRLAVQESLLSERVSFLLKGAHLLEVAVLPVVHDSGLRLLEPLGHSFELI
mmetsp:Transcript_34688/g.53176  ORF Transcript_34688/g.53176 Transcript_34688/m.53176 type:complete len:237 (+) Transcript_34688:1641-2351(+)